MHDMELPNSLLAIARAGGREQHSRGKVRGSRPCGVQHTRRKRQRREGAGAGGTAFDVEKIVPAIEWVQTLKAQQTFQSRWKRKIRVCGAGNSRQKAGRDWSWRDRRARCERRTDARHAGIRLRPVPFRGRCMEPFERHCEGRFRG